MDIDALLLQRVGATINMTKDELDELKSNVHRQQEEVSFWLNKSERETLDLYETCGNDPELRAIYEERFSILNDMKRDQEDFMEKFSRYIKETKEELEKKDDENSDT